MFDDPGIALVEVVQKDQRRKIPLLRNGKQTPLTPKEIKEYRESTIVMLKELWRAIDYGVTLTTGDGESCNVWTSTTDEDTGKVADGLLTLGLRSIPIAMLIRGTVKAERVYGAGSVLVQNGILTAMHYTAHGIAIPLMPGASKP